MKNKNKIIIFIIIAILVFVLILFILKNIKNNQSEDTKVSNFIINENIYTTNNDLSNLVDIEF